MEGMGQGEIFVWVGLFLLWYGGVTLFFNVERLNWAIFPWTLLVFAGTLGIIFGSAWMSDDAKGSMLAVFVVIDFLLVFLFPGFVMIRIGGKWRKFGIILVCIPAFVVAGVAAFLASAYWYCSYRDCGVVYCSYWGCEIVLNEAVVPITMAADIG